MSFAEPAFLAALALVPLALAAQILARRRARRYAVRFPGVPTLAPLLPRASAWRRRVPLALFLAALTVFAVALARPQRTVAVPKDQAAIVLVNDVSRSMLAEDVEPSRLEAAREAALRFLEEVPDATRVGAVGFSTNPHTIEPPTDEHEEIEALVAGLNADGGTATGEALATALGLADSRARDLYSSAEPPPDLRRRPRDKRPPAAIVLLSDGKTTLGRDPVEVARIARRLNVPIHTVALGTSEGVIQTPDGVTVRVPPDPETMKDIADASGGRAFEVDDGDQLAEIYEDLGSRVATEKEKREITAAFAAGGAALLLAATALGLRATARLP